MYNLREIIEKSNIIENFSGRISFDEKLAGKTSFKIGGDAPVFAEPKDVHSLIKFLNFLKSNEIPYFIMGGGTNLVVSDEGFEGAVISTLQMNTISIEESEEKIEGNSAGKTVYVRAEAGAAMNRLVNFCTENCLSGIEKFAGLPGTVGGAAFMNARCFNLSLSDVFYSANYIEAKCTNSKCTDAAEIERHGENINSCEFIERLYNFNPADWDYKVSPFSKSLRSQQVGLKPQATQSGQFRQAAVPETKIITSVIFRLTQKEKGGQAQIEKECAEFIRQRVEKGHFKFPCAGSVFKNNRDFGEPTGKIIDSLGLKGYSIGGAQVAPWHGNIIINTGKATQKDVLKLTDFLKKKVYEEKGFLLENEIIFCGKTH